jgi:hypothetical protein
MYSVSPNQLRHLLFNINNQKMFVEDLRRKLFSIDSALDDTSLGHDEW